MKWNVFPGDSRMKFLNNIIINEKIQNLNLNITSVEILPIPVTRDGKYITDSKILLSDFFF